MVNEYIRIRVRIKAHLRACNIYGALINKPQDIRVIENHS